MDICAIPLDDDVTFKLGGIAPIREEDEYGGNRVSIMARFETIKTPLKIDITTGDIITPDAIRMPFIRALKPRSHFPQLEIASKGNIV